MNLFYKPFRGVIGDCIPFYADGRYHIFYLHDPRDADGSLVDSGWDHISTTDFVHFEEHGIALPPGQITEQHYGPATGCVFTDSQGKHHIFYTGMNHTFRNDHQFEQVLMRATSDDLVHWTRTPGWQILPDLSIYERHDWRDPFVFQHPETGKYMMIVAARLNDGPKYGRGCTGLLTSEDLEHWTVEQPLYTPRRYHGHECPDWFKMGDWYYLVFSEYTTLTTTRYVMSKSPDGPWIAPGNNTFDNRAFYAAKSASDGSRRFLFGWNPTKLGNQDNGEWQWGGCLTVHEIIQNSDGTLSVQAPPEVTRAFASPHELVLESKLPGWTLKDDTVSGTAPFGYSLALSQPMPETYLLQGELNFESHPGSAGLLLRMDDSGDNGYFLRFNAVAQRLEFGKIGGYRHWYVDHMPELERPLVIQTGIPLRFKIFVDKTAVVAYVNDQVALSGRMYINPFGRCGLFVDGTSIKVEGLAAHTMRE